MPSSRLSTALTILATLFLQAQPILSAPQPAGAVAAAAAASPSVTIASGVVIGTTTTLATPTRATAAVTKYVGIPFASSPPLRFGPPKPAASWTKPLHAVTTRAACIQEFADPQSGAEKEMALFNNPGYPPPEESEDCLYLNVYVPPGTKASAGKAVLFWIFGGNLAFGTGGLQAYDGSSFAYNQDVIVVTHNYRTNIFGFPGAPKLEAPNQNPGFLDQRAALKWVHANIRAFGGDPSKVTIFGESAGGYSVKNLLALPPSPLNFRGAIMESEAALQESESIMFASNQSDGSSWDALAVAIGCGATQLQPALECVRGKTAADIKSTIETLGVGFFPVVDGVTHVSNVAPAIESGTAAKVPFMIGTNQNEGRPFIYILGGEDEDATLAELLGDIFPNNAALVTELEGLFPGQSAYEAASTVLTEFAFLCPASMLASLAQSNGYTVYRYLFNATFPNSQIFPDAGVWHSSEIPEVFGTYPLANATTQEIKLSKYMQTAWANFAKNPSTGPGEDWPELGSAGNVQNLGGNGINGGKTILASSIDQSCTLFAAIINEEGL